MLLKWKTELVNMKLTYLMRVGHPLRALELVAAVVVGRRSGHGPKVELVVGRVVAAAGAHALRLGRRVGVQRLAHGGNLLKKWKGDV